MNKVYEAVADCRKTFVEMSFAFTHDINEIEEAVYSRYKRNRRSSTRMFNVFFTNESLSIKKYF
jgi:hypothetical protein